MAYFCCTDILASGPNFDLNNSRYKRVESFNCLEIIFVLTQITDT